MIVRETHDPPKITSLTMQNGTVIHFAWTHSMTIYSKEFHPHDETRTEEDH